MGVISYLAATPSRRMSYMPDFLRGKIFMIGIILFFVLGLGLIIAWLIISLLNHIKLEKKLIHDYQQLEFLMGAADTNIYVVDENLNLIYVDPKRQRIYGDPSGKKCYHYFGKGQSECDVCDVRNAFSQGGVAIRELTLPRENNKVVQVTTIPFSDEKGEKRVAEVNVDITHYKRIEKELEKSRTELDSLVQERTNDLKRVNQSLEEELAIRRKMEAQLEEDRGFLQMLIEAIPAPVFYKDAEGRYQLSNDVFAEQVLGAKKERILGCTVFDLPDLIPSDLATIYHEADQKLLAESGTQCYEAEVMYADGERHHVYFTKALCQSMGGEPLGIIGVMLDVSDLRKAEKARQEMEKRYQQARKFESLNVMATNIAHNFNNILTSARGFLEMTLTDLPPEHPSHDNMKQSLKSISRALELSSIMMLCVGQGQNSSRPVDINRTLRQLETVIRSTLDNGVSLRLELEDDAEVFIEGDSAQIQQALIAVISNGVEAMKQTDGPLTIRTSRQFCSREFLEKSRFYESQIEGDYVMIEIDDAGHGMDEETLSNIFDPFFSTRFTGRGLGMSAVLGIVRGHRGAIFIESAPENGCNVKMFFPCSPSIA
ncbi:MAG: PAS domain-containing protein [Candidatus Sumerlaeia bacterium]